MLSAGFALLGISFFALPAVSLSDDGQEGLSVSTEQRRKTKKCFFYYFFLPPQTENASQQLFSPDHEFIIHKITVQFSHDENMASFVPVDVS